MSAKEKEAAAKQPFTFLAPLTNEQSCEAGRKSAKARVRECRMDKRVNYDIMSAKEKEAAAKQPFTFLAPLTNKQSCEAGRKSAKARVRECRIDKRVNYDIIQKGGYSYGRSELCILYGR